jgi:hypothetical protein
MCFSAPASFVAGGALSFLGVRTLSKTKKNAERFFASIPLLFGIQQLTEGVIWISFNMPLVNTIATYIYLFLAFPFWPAFTPIAVYLLEKNKRRKMILRACIVAGGILGVYLLWVIIIAPIQPVVIYHSIQYPIAPPHGYFLVFVYVFVTCGSCLLSTHSLVRAFGALLIVSFGIAALFYINSFFSVWCYFAAILSVIVYIFFARR